MACHDPNVHAWQQGNATALHTGVSSRRWTGCRRDCCEPDDRSKSTMRVQNDQHVCRGARYTRPRAQHKPASARPKAHQSSSIHRCITQPFVWCKGEWQTCACELLGFRGRLVARDNTMSRRPRAALGSANRRAPRGRSPLACTPRGSIILDFSYI